MAQLLCGCFGRPPGDADAHVGASLRDPKAREGGTSSVTSGAEVEPQAGQQAAGKAAWQEDSPQLEGRSGELIDGPPHKGTISHSASRDESDPGALAVLVPAAVAPLPNKHADAAAEPATPPAHQRLPARAASPPPAAAGQAAAKPEPLHEQASHEAPLHPDAHSDGGLACTNDALLKEQREAITAWLASMGRKIFTGNFNLISTPFPVVMFEPRSYLEKLADVWVYPRFLQQASACPHDPLERMKLVVTWFVAGLHHGFEKWKKPFNPILGETWQASLSDGSSMFMEQVSHHPPVTAFNLLGPGGSYRFTGLSQPNVTIALKHYGVRTVAKGFRCLDFADGSRIEMAYPGYSIKGVVYSTRPRAEVDGAAVFTDAAHGLRAEVRFGPNKGARAPVLRRSDAILGEIYQLPPGNGNAAAATTTRPHAAGDALPEHAEGAAPGDLEAQSSLSWQLSEGAPPSPSPAPVTEPLPDHVQAATASSTPPLPPTPQRTTLPAGAPAAAQAAAVGAVSRGSSAPSLPSVSSAGVMVTAARSAATLRGGSEDGGEEEQEVDGGEGFETASETDFDARGRREEDEAGGAAAVQEGEAAARRMARSRSAAQHRRTASQLRMVAEAAALAAAAEEAAAAAAAAKADAAAALLAAAPGERPPQQQQQHGEASASPQEAVATAGHSSGGGLSGPLLVPLPSGTEQALAALSPPLSPRLSDPGQRPPQAPSGHVEGGAKARAVSVQRPVVAAPPARAHSAAPGVFSGFSGLSRMMLGLGGSGSSVGSMAAAAAAGSGHGAAVAGGPPSAVGGAAAAAQGQVVARLEGSWLSHLNIDGRRYWTLAREAPDAWTPAPASAALPSDSRFRQDLVHIQRGDVRGAQEWKERLEVAQRHDKKVREAGGAARH